MSIFSSSANASQKSMLGEMLVRKNLISRDQLNAALLRQKATSEHLGEVIVSMGLLTEKQLSRALTRQKSYRYALALAALLTAPFAPAIAVSGAPPSTSTTSTSTTNLAPVISGTPATSVNAGSPYRFRPTASDPEGKTLYFRIRNKPGWATFNSKTGTLSGTPTSAGVGNYTNIQISASDGVKQTYAAPFSISVKALGNVIPNQAPVATNSSRSVAEDSSVSGIANATDADGQTLTYSLVQNVTHGTLTFNQNTGAYTYSPAPNFSGDDSFQFRVQDPSGATASARVTFTVSSVNDAPVARAGSFNGTEDTILAGNLAATDVDGDPLHFSMSGSAAHGTVTITNAATGSFSYTPALNYTGTDSFTFRVSDGHGGQSTAQASINITGANDAPTASNASFQVNEDQTLSGQVTGRDPDGSNLTYSLVTTAGHGTVSLNSANGSFAFTPARNYNGPDTFTFRVTDAQGSAATAQVSVTVLSVDDVPIAVGDNASTSTNTPVTIAVLNNDTNLGDGNIRVSIANTPGHGAAIVSNNQVVYTPTNNYSGSDSISYRVTDADGDTSVATIAITATCTQNCPADVTLGWSAPTTRTDGTALTNLAGYLVHYGTSRGTYTNSIDVSGATTLTHRLQSLPAGTYYFSVTAYDSSGAESSYSTEITRTIN